MTRRLFLLLASLALAACTPVDYQALQQSTVERMRQAVAARFASQFGPTIDGVLGALAGEGGFLHNPLVKVLLPPPLGLALAMGQAMADNPEEAMLEVLINRAAGEAIPLAGPVLRDSLQALVVDGRLTALLSGEPGAVTEALRAESEDKLKAALVSAIGKSLENSGAGKLYDTLVAVRGQVARARQAAEAGPAVLTQVEEADSLESLFALAEQESPNGPGDAGEKAPERAEEDEPTDLAALLGEPPTKAPPPPETLAAGPATETLDPEQLDDYIADRAVDGLFKLLAEKENSLRARLEVPEAF